MNIIKKEKSVYVREKERERTSKKKKRICILFYDKIA